MVILLKTDILGLLLTKNINKKRYTSHLSAWEFEDFVIHIVNACPTIILFKVCKLLHLQTK